MTPWNELSPLDQYRLIYNDLHKDFYGIRPNYDELDSWDLEKIKDKINHINEHVTKFGWPDEKE
mgnify:CR=1 FL=1